MKGKLGKLEHWKNLLYILIITEGYSNVFNITRVMFKGINLSEIYSIFFTLEKMKDWMKIKLIKYYIIFKRMNQSSGGKII